MGERIFLVEGNVGIRLVTDLVAADISAKLLIIIVPIYVIREKFMHDHA